MLNINPMLLLDWYKIIHPGLLPKGITKSMSYFTPRKSRIEVWDSVVNFGLQGFCKTFLIDYFNEEFFRKPLEEVLASYKETVGDSFDEDIYDISIIENLWKLQYLPIEIISLPEGTKVPMHVPVFGITNTHDDFAWLPQSLESLISAEMWHPMISATVGTTYREIVNRYCSQYCDDDVIESTMLGDFSFRGQECLQSAIKSSAAWSLSFLNSATVPSIPYLKYCYNATGKVLLGAVSTEHSVMCSNYAIDGDEITLLRRLLKKYKSRNFSVVCDSYDYDNIVENIIPQLKQEILEHNGTMLVRGDSGTDCVKVVTDTVFKLWKTFGGTINSKGLKVLDWHIRAIYGDSITTQRCEEAYRILVENGFAPNNIVLGVGSFSMQAIEVNGILHPFTRDTFSSCIKATYMEVNGKPYPIFKDPKEGGFKTSQKGLCYVFINEDGELDYKDGYTHDNIPEGNLLETVFKDGRMVKEQSLSEIRNILNDGKF